MRQLGVGCQGGAEAPAISLPLIFDEWASGSLDTLQARIKVDERNCFGLIEHGAVRNSASSFLPVHAAVARWKHRALPFVEQEGVQSMPKDRGAEQGDVDGPSECSLALGMVAAEAQMCIATQRAARTLAWIGMGDSLHERRLRDEPYNFQFGGPEKLIGAGDPRRAQQETEALRTNGIWMMVTSSVTRDWFYLSTSVRCSKR